jgi:hypothetical protein
LRRAVLEGVALVTLVVVLLTGCATMEVNPKTAIGAGGGAPPLTAERRPPCDKACVN